LLFADRLPQVGNFIIQRLERRPGGCERPVFVFGRTGLHFHPAGGIMRRSLIPQAGQFFIHAGQFLASLQGKLFLFEQLGDLNQALGTALLPFTGLFREAFEPFG
jgi:hypothetical protein